MNNTHTANQRRQFGVTLIELMVVVAIIAIISAVAYPSYQRYVVKAKRTVAQNTLLQIADRQQQFFMDNKRFTADLTDLGFPADPHVVDDDGNSTVAGDSQAVYSLSLSNVTATTWTITAAPLHGQLTRDTYCGSLTITQAGTKGKTGASDKCW
ncbi:MAG: prepilin-type N-terminal cleavage/methylation domain-containing protein [Gammaproteobacteria bacterium]|jgi:type IV pilus assembly protein PilE|nr:prepilin-type N-terminal cleavage/methylation domain-containing protein [Gammaproteobacteria bacterium]MDH3777247.1 prepilin-type N-terminal cleavage/methylation domain-containing protein [Gammaproteobacteria bacterium]MDH3810070.1 prepilin-type N-terminal cleavage/methylation domain-containing protein [Gammaproteobacteria bacterium]